MEKRNTLLLTIIAIATLLVAVVGATFAYFASNIQTNKLNVDVNTSASKASFTATSDGTIDINVDGWMMQQNNAGDGSENTSNDEDAQKNLTASANLTVNLNASDSGNITRCKYDVVWKWQNGSADFESAVSGTTSLASGKQIYPSKYYVRTQTTSYTEDFKELTIEGTESVTGTNSDSQDHPHNGDAFAGAGEKNIDTFSALSGNNIKLLSDEEIATDQDVSVTYKFDVKFYNLPTDQSTLKGKNFKAVISVDNVRC